MSYEQFRPTSFKLLPLVVKNLLIINGLFYLGSMAIGKAFKIDLDDIFGLHYVTCAQFKPYQFITYMFMHGSFMHILFNMFALWMFGYVLENVWGPKRFLLYYLVTGVGAALVQIFITYLRIRNIEAGLSPDAIQMVYNNGAELLKTNINYKDSSLGSLNILINTPIIGASGAVFGILLAFGMMFPNTLIYIYFAIPMKAKWFVILYGAVELYYGFANSASDNVAHFAHLGGMLFGFFLIIYWRKVMKRNNFS